MATARTRSSPRCCCTSATSDAAIGHRDLERVVDRRQMAVEHGVEHDALDLDDPPGGTVLSGHARSFISSRGAHELYRRRPRCRADPCQQACRIAPRAARGSSGVTKSGRRARRAELAATAGGRPACRSCSSRRRSRTAARRRTAPWASAATSASPRRRRRARPPPTPRRPRRRRAPRARGAAGACGGSSGSSPAGTGLGGVVRTCSTTASASARHSVQSSQYLEVLVERRALDLADLAVRGHGDPQPGHLAERRKRDAGVGVQVMSVWRAGRGRRRTPDGCLFPPAWTRSAWKSLHAAAELRQVRLRRGARRGAGRRRGAHRRPAARRP